MAFVRASFTQLGIKQWHVHDVHAYTVEVLKELWVTFGIKLEHLECESCRKKRESDILLSRKFQQTGVKMKYDEIQFSQRRRNDLVHAVRVVHKYLSRFLAALFSESRRKAEHIQVGVAKVKSKSFSQVYCTRKWPLLWSLKMRSHITDTTS